MAQLNEDSGDSDEVREALRKAQMLEKGLTGLSPDQRYIARKTDVALALMEQTQKAIKAGLENKLKSYKAQMADELLNKARGIDID